MTPTGLAGERTTDPKPVPSRCHAWLRLCPGAPDPDLSEQVGTFQTFTLLVEETLFYILPYRQHKGQVSNNAETRGTRASAVRRSTRLVHQGENRARECGEMPGSQRESRKDKQGEE